MSPMNQQSRRLCPPFQWLAAGLPLLVIALGLLAVRPDWHAAVHVPIADAAAHKTKHSHDADTAERGCAIELFAAGLIESMTFGAPALKPHEIFATKLALPTEQLLIAAVRLEPPGRAPPSIS